MAVPIVYRKNQEASIATYDYTDAIQGLGYINYYGVNATTQESNGASFAYISKSAIQSQTPYRVFTITGGSMAEMLNADWDLSFNIPDVVGGGNLSVTGTLEEENASVGGAKRARVDLEVYKVDASNTETLLAQSSGATILWDANTPSARYFNAKVALPITKIKAGEKLRITTYVYGFVATSSDTFKLYCDGANSGTTLRNIYWSNSLDAGFKGQTKLVFSVPHRIDL